MDIFTTTVTIGTNNNNNNNNNVIHKEAEKKLKYKNLSIEIKRMWNMKCYKLRLEA
jgi:hypothetical protein